jgi:hypothetical protein
MRLSAALHVVAVFSCLPACPAYAFLNDTFVKNALSHVKIFTYDLESAGLGPRLESFSPSSPVCTSCSRPRDPTAADLCNYAFGSPIFSPLGYAYQGLVWSNKGRGECLAIQVHKRLSISQLSVRRADDANLFFIPIYAAQLCMNEAYARFQECGVDFKAHSNFTAIWAWLLQQPSFRQSDGADHFMIIARPWDHVAKVCYVVTSRITVSPVLSCVSTTHACVHIYNRGSVSHCAVCCWKAFRSRYKKRCSAAPSASQAWTPL